jgi:hypothetical protein
MSRALKGLLREPLLHFLLLGALLFGLDAWLRQPAGSDANTEIVVSAARVNMLAQNYKRTWQRRPTRAELEGLVAEYVREEVLYREALALGLDRDDTIIRRRLRQKMEFVSDEAAALDAPTDAELAEYLAANADAFRIEPRATFAQVFLDPRKRDGSLEADVARLREALNGVGDWVPPSEVGDSLLLLEPRYADISPSEVARLFGAEFAEALFAQPVGQWVGPIASGYGVHLVRLDALTPGRIPALAEVRPVVEREWSGARRKELSDAFYNSLRAKYQVTVRMPVAGQSGDGAAAKHEPEAAKP